MNKKCTFERWIVIVISLSVMLACSLPTGSSTQGDMQQTQIALGIQQTMVIQQQTELASKKQPTSPPTDVPAVATYTPYPTYTQPPANTAAPSATQPPAATVTWTVPPEPTQVNMEEKIRGANILILEDVKGYFALTPLVHQAIGSMDFSGGKIVEVDDRIGDFMSQLNSPTKWDLIIVAAEARSGVRGEFWDVIMDQVNHKVGLIAEVWYLDQIANGRIAPLLGKCGVRFEKNWGRSTKYDQLNYSLYWLDQNNEVFSKPNVVGPLYTPTIYWDYKIGSYDAGDLLSLGTGGDAQLLAGLQPKEKSYNGVLASCLSGRMILQTFSSHDYRSSQVVPLWQNYITYTLTNHFKAIQ
jgi:hypothetical protein